jgi:hypothetical protein
VKREKGFVMAAGFPRSAITAERLRKILKEKFKQCEI